MSYSLFSFKAEPNALKGKTILVTGATQGIGKACAIEYAKLGANLILLGKSQERLDEIYDQIEALNPSSNMVQVCLDLVSLDESQCNELCQLILEAFGQLDGLVHNAGVLSSLSNLSKHTVADFDRTLAVNLRAPFILTKALLPALANSDSSSVIFTSSSVGRTGRAFWNSYAVSKGGLENLMEVFADELYSTHNIRVNSINPGGTRTQMRATAYPHENPEELPEASEVTDLFVYLMHDKSQSTNGQALDVRVAST